MLYEGARGRVVVGEVGSGCCSILICGGDIKDNTEAGSGSTGRFGRMEVW